MTAFVHARIEIAPELAFVIDGNSKITCGNGTYANPAPNAFSLPAASVQGHPPRADLGFCPGSTPTCRASCYVKGLAANAPDVYVEYRENAATLRAILADHALGWRAAWALGSWIAEHARDGFRWHVSGDVWGAEHARWITSVCFVSRDVRHWIYTRTFEAVGELVRAPNLAVNVSADRDNYDVARAVARRHGARLAYMSTTPDDVPAGLPLDAVIFPDYPLRGRDLADKTSAPFWVGLPHTRRLQICPADFFGQSENHRCGPCTKCLVRQS